MSKSKNSKAENKLINILDFNPDNLVFSELKDGKAKDDPKITFRRIYFKIKNVVQELDDEGNVIRSTNELSGTEGDVYIQFPEMFCFGVQENKSMDDKKKDEVSGYSCSFVLQNKDGPTQEQLEVTKKIKDLIERVKNHVLTLKGKIGRNNDKLKVDVQDLDKLIYQKRDKETNEILHDAGPPSINPKLMGYKDTILTTFYKKNEYGEVEEVDALDLLSTENKKNYFKGTPTLKLESIFINAKTISIQWKVSECDVEQSQNAPTKFRQFSAKSYEENNALTAVKKVNSFSAKAMLNKHEEDGNDDDFKLKVDEDIIVEDEDEPAPVPVKSVKKKKKSDN
jgi:hypothetical protein